MKRCNRCHIDKPESEFYKDSHTPSGLRYYCKVCGRKINNVYREKNPNKIKETKQEKLVMNK